MPRRDAFTGLRDSKKWTDVEDNQQHSSTMLPAQPLDLIPTADFKKKRSREWERNHRSETVTYRGIPRHVVNLIVEIAQSLSVPRDEVVRVFLEYSVSLYRNRQLKLYAFPKAQRMTLFPEGSQGNTVFSSSKSENRNWLTEAFPVPEKKATGTKKKTAKKDQVAIPQWELRVTFRIPALLKEEVRSIAREHTLPVGEIVWFFIIQGSKAFQNGSLILYPQPKTIRKTLFQE